MGKSIREKLSAKLSGYPYGIWILCLSITAFCSVPILLKSGFDAGSMARLFLFFFAPSAILYIKRLRSGEVGLAEFLAALCIFIPVVFRWIPAWSKTVFGPSTPVAYWGMSIFILVAFCGIKGLDLNSSWKFGLEDLKAVLKALFVLFAVIVPIGLWSGFLVAGTGSFNGISAWHIPVAFVLILIATAIPEEILCRGIIQNAIASKLGAALGIFFASIVFGLGHITRIVPTSIEIFSFPNWWYVLFASIAGIGYGWVYHKRKSLVAAAVLHALVDLIWGLFFRN